MCGKHTILPPGLPLAAVAMSLGSLFIAACMQVLRDLKAHFFKGQSIQPGTISVHIRRGNKVSRQGGGEMSYVTDAKYIKHAVALQSSSRVVLKQAVFVSTEDPSAVQALQQNMSGWQVQYTTVPRNNHQGQAVSKTGCGLV